MFKDIIVKRKNKRLNPYSLLKICNQYPELSFRIIIAPVPVPEVAEAMPIKIPRDAIDLGITFGNIVVNRDNYINTTPDLVAYWISLFCQYGVEFQVAYEEYLTDPDEGVELIEDIREYVTETLKVLPRTGKITASDIKATCHVIIVSMKKSFSSDPGIRDRQLQKYITERKSAIYEILGKAIGELVFKDNFFLRISDTFTALPKLRRTLFLFCYQNQSLREFWVACTLFVYEFVEITRAICYFITSRKKTEAHADPIILEEIEKFLQTAKEKKMKLGAVWPFHRIIDPSDRDLNIKNFPNLTICAVEYQKQHGNETFENTTYIWDDHIPIMYKDMLKKAMTVDKHPAPDVLAFSRMVEHESRIINLDLDMLMKIIIEQAEVYAEELNQDEIREIVETEACAGELIQDEIREIVEPEAYTGEQVKEYTAKELYQDIRKIREIVVSEADAAEMIQNDFREMIDAEAYAAEMMQDEFRQINEAQAQAQAYVAEMMQDEFRQINEAQAQAQAYAAEMMQDEFRQINEAQACAGELTQNEIRDINKAYKRFFAQHFK